MEFPRLTTEENMLLARLGDLFGLSRAKGVTKYSSFLNERQSALAEIYVKQNRCENWMMYGGRENAARKVLGAFSPFEEPHEDAFPITGITVSFPKHAELTHRDFLGALTSLKIARESIGDLLVSPGRCDMFVLKPVAFTVIDELTKVGSFGVSCAEAVPGDFVVLEQFEELRGTISSARADCLVSMITGLAREKALSLINSGAVNRNWLELENGACRFAAGDVFSIKGHGRFIVDDIGAPTKKGRLPVRCRKYK